MRKIIITVILLSFFISFDIFSKNINDSKSHKPYAVVLGIAQDGGYPHAGCERRCCADLWKNDSLKKMVSCISVIDPKSGLAWMIDATPDFAKQYHIITKEHNARLAGIFLTHAHIGHYTGLMHLGREVMGSKNIVVYAMPKMKLFLENNEPWKQLVSLKNIHIIPIEDKKEIILSRNLIIEPFKVPHRDEFSETVGYNIIGPNESLLYIPDIDKWDKWEHDILFWIESTGYALLDGTFYYDGEIPNRNMSEIPHPFIMESMNYFETLLERNQNKIFFIHLNHTNPAIRENSAASRNIIKNGFNVARKGMKLYL
jgi:pyrroloquinoline quinone biosynthesis protein B